MIFTKNINERNENWWFFKEIKQIYELVNVEPEFVCDYQDQTREMILDKCYYDLSEEELEKCREIEECLIQYSYRDKKRLIELIKLNF